MTKIYVGVPCYDGIDPRAFASIAVPSLVHDHLVEPRPCSLLGQSFNELWCECLNDGSYTHFAMHHADIEAPPGWADTLFQEMAEYNADVISVVVAIKDERALTSTGYMDFRPTVLVNRLTLTQVFGLPETFGPPPGGEVGLAVNTGLMLVKLGGWVEDFPGFNVKTYVLKHKGKWVASNFPEDWAFSGFAHLMGLRVMATRKVKANHIGKKRYANDHDWGTWAYDHLYEEIRKESAA